MRSTASFLIFLLSLALFSACTETPAPPPPPQPSAPAENTPPAAPPTPNDTAFAATPPAPAPDAPTPPALDTPAAAPKIPLPTAKKSATPTPLSGFLDIESLDASIGLDIRYATTNNFTKAQIYDCPKCYLRPEAARAIVRAHQALQKKGMGLKMYDCYRPRPYQQRLWDKVPNPDYVTPPAKGSMHGRGAAVDLTIVDKKGKELDMGTPYDFFGEEAHFDYTKLPAQVLANRRLLRETLEAEGFKGIRTEWWHFSFGGKDFPLSEAVWPCK